MNNLKVLVDKLEKVDFDAYNDNHNEIEEKNALQVLSEFRDKFSKLKPHKKSSEEIYNHNIVIFLHIDNALLKKEYAKACHEIISLNHYTDIMQARIFHNLLSLLNKYI